MLCFPLKLCLTAFADLVSVSLLEAGAGEPGMMASPCPWGPQPSVALQGYLHHPAPLPASASKARPQAQGHHPSPVIPTQGLVSCAL